MKKKYYVTTPIYYPSAKLHIGHAYTTVAGDVLKRYKQKKGYDTFYLTGTDEHGQKIETVAQENNMNPKEYVDDIVLGIKDLWKSMDISYDKFIRTTDPEHIEAVQKIFTKLLENDDVYLGKYSGLYCRSDEAYYTKTQARDNVCPDCGRILEVIEEESYFFRCSKYIDRLVKLYEDHPDFLKPESRLKELINNFIEPGLEDLAVSRTTFTWGIPVRENKKHVIYVWLDALTNYITALGYESDDDRKFQDFWPADVHLVGKEITRFHVIYWPMILMALDLPTPRQIYAHGWLLMANDKMSKSKGNVIYPDFIVDNYGSDVLRYYLLREVPFGADGSFTPTTFINRYNNDLTNDLSNLVNRTIAMINKYYMGEVSNNAYTNENHQNYDKIILKNVNEFDNELNDLNFSKALSALWNIISNTNKMIDLEQPWLISKDINLNNKQLSKILWRLCNSLEIVANMLEAFMPNTAKLICSNLNVELKNEIEDFKDINTDKYIVKANPEIIYNRLNVDEEVERISIQMNSDLNN